MSYLNKNKISSDFQHGLRTGLTTYHAVNKFSHLYSLLDGKVSVLSVFVEFSKAFDIVNHNILPQKRHYYAIRGTMLSWFSTYLVGRSQCTILDGYKSL